jgi:GTP-binding protein
LQKTVVTFAGSAASPRQFPKDGLPEVAFLGRSNVGKSSLLNALAGVRGLAEVSSKPGRTRLVNFFRFGNELYLADLPGYGYAKVSEKMRMGWEDLVRSYLEEREPLALCVFIVDARRDATDNDWILKDYLDERSLPYVIAATKSDTLPRHEVKERREALAKSLGETARDVVAVSSTTGTGLKELWTTIRAAVSQPSGGERNNGR